MTPLQAFIAAALVTLFCGVIGPEFDAKYNTLLQRSFVLVMTLVFGALCAMATVEYIHLSPPVEHHPCEVNPTIVNCD